MQVGVEPLGVVEHDGGSHLPGGEEDAPRGLRPAGVRERPVDVVLAKVHPVSAGQRVGEGVAVIAGDHLRHGGGAGGEVDEHRLAGAGGAVGREARRGGVHRLAEIRPARARRGAAPPGDDDEPLEGRAGGADRVDLVGVVVGHDREAGPRRVDPVLDVPRGKEARRRHRDDPRLGAPDEHVVPGGDAGDHHVGEVSAPGPELPEDVREPVRGAGEVAEGERGDRLAGWVDRDAGRLVGRLRTGVDEIEPEVVVLRSLESNLPAGLLVVRHVRQVHRVAPCLESRRDARAVVGPRPASI